MIDGLSFVAALWLATVAPVAAPRHQLREISGVPAGETVCANVVVHANSAIATTLRDDATIVRTIARLRAVDLDEGAPGRDTILSEFGRLASEINDGTVHGSGETRRLHALGDDRRNLRSADDLHAFAAALEGALGRQQKIAVDLAGFVRFLDFHELRDVALPPGYRPSNYAGGETDNRPPHAFEGSLTNPYDRPGRTFSAMARAAAADFEQRIEEVAADESRAADHSEAAVTGC